NARISRRERCRRTWGPRPNRLWGLRHLSAPPVERLELSVLVQDPLDGNPSGSHLCVTLVAPSCRQHLHELQCVQGLHEANGHSDRVQRQRQLFQAARSEYRFHSQCSSSRWFVSTILPWLEWLVNDLEELVIEIGPSPLGDHHHGSEWA